MGPPKPVRSTNSETVVGSETPRLWTPPLVELTPETSYGFDFIDFCDQVCGVDLDPWQRWLAIRIGEMLADGRPRFRYILVLVSRQNGKTMFARLLTLYWLFVEQVTLVLGTSTSRDYAKDSWRAVCQMAKENPYLAADLSDKSVRETIGEESLTLASGPKYRIAAANRRAGRSLTVDRLIIDEIREHTAFDSWDASTYAMQAVPTAQAVCISNQGDVTAIVLDYLRTSALDYIETGDGDPRIGLFEWSSPPGSDPEDLDALAAANPSMGIRITADTLLGQAKAAKASGGEALAGFRTEAMCMRVHLMDAAIDEESWNACGRDDIDLAEHRDRVALCLDIALDGSHATLMAAVSLPDGVHLDVVDAWDGHGCVAQVKRDLPKLVARVRPARVGWFPQGPAAAMGAEMRPGWQPRRCEVETITSDLTAACMGIAADVVGQSIVHGNDPLLTRHAVTAQKLRRGDAWVFGRRDSGPIDAIYAAAGATFLAKTMPPPRPKLVAL